jgi:hypothetical protein
MLSIHTIVTLRQVQGIRQLEGFGKMQAEDGYKKASLHKYRLAFLFGGPDQIRTGDKGFADLCLTTWRRGRILS